MFQISVRCVARWVQPGALDSNLSAQHFGSSYRMEADFEAADLVVGTLAVAGWRDHQLLAVADLVPHGWTR